MAGCSSTHIKESKDDLPFLGKGTLQRFNYENGLRLLVVEDHRSPTFAYQVWYRVGARNEKSDATGLAHLFEHMMFKGTKNYEEGAFERILEESGVEGLNAWTSSDFTSYIQELPKDKLELIIKLDSDRMVNLIVDNKAFTTEREVVQNERRYRTENSPDGIMYQTLFEEGFQQHPYHWPVIGYEEHLNRLTAKVAEDFYKANYAPDNATIVVVGDVDSSEVAELVGKYYGNIVTSRTERRPLTEVTPVEPPQTSQKRKTLPLNIQVEKLLMGFHIESYRDPEAPIYEVLEGILTKGKSARLKKALVDSGIASSVGSGSDQGLDPSLYLISVDLQKGKSAVLAEGIIMRELDKLAKTPISKAELSKALNQLEFDFYQNFGENDSKARFIGKFESVFGDYEKGLEFRNRIMQVAPADIQKMVKKHFTASNSVIIKGVPK